MLDSEFVDADLSRGAEAFSESSTFLPELGSYHPAPEGCLELIHKDSKQVSIPILASLNGVMPGAGCARPAKWNRPARMPSN